MLALVVAISLSAFTSLKDSKVRPLGTDYYWFEVADQSNSSNLIPGDFVELTDKTTEMSSSHSNCQDQVLPRCRLGYEASQLDFTDPDNPTVIQTSPGTYEQPVQQIKAVHFRHLDVEHQQCGLKIRNDVKGLVRIVYTLDLLLRR